MHNVPGAFDVDAVPAAVQPSGGALERVELRVESLQLLRLRSLSLSPPQGDLSSKRSLLQSDCRSVDLDRPLDLDRNLNCDLSPDLKTGLSREGKL